MRGRTKRTTSVWQWSLAFLVCCLCLPVMAAGADNNEVNTIKSIKNVGSSSVEIELTSTRDFQVRNALIEMRVGDLTFTRSRHPDDGNLNTIIFILTAQDWANAKNGARVIVGFPNEPDSEWDFGLLNKSRRGK